MSMRTVYIRKDNEDFFDNLEKKSETINAILDKLRKRKLNEPEYTPPESSA